MPQLDLVPHILPERLSQAVPLAPVPVSNLRRSPMERQGQNRAYNLVGNPHVQVWRVMQGIGLLERQGPCWRRVELVGGMVQVVVAIELLEVV